MELIQINNAQQGIQRKIMYIKIFFLISCSDTALNLAVHRQKYTIVDLLLQYHANPNLSNQAGKTALHRAVVSYTNENAKQIRRLLDVSLFNWDERV
jgi:ankyrin repeat protein